MATEFTLTATAQIQSMQALSATLQKLTIDGGTNGTDVLIEQDMCREFPVLEDVTIRNTFDNWTNIGTFFVCPKI